MVFKRGKTNNKVTMGTDNIEVVNKTKFLGMFWDPELSWTHHIKYTIEKSTNRINLLRYLSGSKWGADRYTLLKLYRSLILSILDYGCEVYNSASNHLLSKLEKVQNNCLRVILRAMKTTPITALQIEACQPPLQIRRNYLLTKYHLKLQGSEKPHPTVVSFSNNHAYLFNSHKLDDNYKSYYVTVEKLMNLYDIESIKTHIVAYL